jgi:hypothetical protein
LFEILEISGELVVQAFLTLNQKADDGRGTYEAVEHMGDERLHQFLSC